MSGTMADNISQIQNLQDAELMSSLARLKGDPSKLATYISSSKANLYNRVVQEHSDTFQKTYGDMVRSNDTVNNTMYYYVRNKDLDKLQSTILSRAQGEAEVASFDAQTGKRQVEVNQWTAGNKQDTLFFLQLLLITFTMLAVLLYLQRIGVVPLSIFVGISSLLSIALILTLIIRAQYTNKTRDNKYWNRRRFQTMGGPPTSTSCPAVSEYINDAQADFSALADQAQSGITAVGNAFGNAGSAFGKSLSAGTTA